MHSSQTCARGGRTVSSVAMSAHGAFIGPSLLVGRSNRSITRTTRRAEPLEGNRVSVASGQPRTRSASVALLADRGDEPAAMRRGHDSALTVRTVLHVTERGNNMKHPRQSLKYVPAKELDRRKVSFDDFVVEDPAGEKLGKLEGFIIDVDEALPYYAVVDAGGWFRSKHILIPIGHFTLDTESKRLVADIPKERVKRFPGFDLDLFPKLTQEDLDRIADEIARVCCPDLVVEPAEVIARLDEWGHYRTPAWWDSRFYTDRPPAGAQEPSAEKSRR
jgi:hypothetical protein